MYQKTIKYHKAEHNYNMVLNSKHRKSYLKQIRPIVPKINSPPRTHTSKIFIKPLVNSTAALA